MTRFFHLASGYAEFEVTGDGARFLNIAVRCGLPLWGFRKAEGKVLARCRARDYRKLLRVCRRSGSRVRLLEKRGLPFQTARLGKRKGLIAGAVLGAALYGFLSCFFWGVSVSGNETVTDREILAAARENGIYAGGWRRGTVEKLASHGVSAGVEKLAWASVNTDGCYAVVAVQEREEKPEIADGKRWSNIVAAREGTVVALSAEQGRPEVRLGETVAKGELLISGLYEEKVDPWGPQPEKPLQTIGPARGTVTAETYREFTVRVSAVKKEFAAIKRRRDLTLTLFGLRIPLGLRTAPEGEYRHWKERRPLKALGTELPVTLETEVFEFQREQVRTLEEKEMRERALRRLRAAQRAELPPGSRVEAEELSWTFGGGSCFLQARCRCLEEIGEEQVILAE